MNLLINIFASYIELFFINIKVKFMVAGDYFLLIILLLAWITLTIMFVYYLKTQLFSKTKKEYFNIVCKQLFFLIILTVVSLIFAKDYYCIFKEIEFIVVFLIILNIFVIQPINIFILFFKYITYGTREIYRITIKENLNISNKQFSINLMKILFYAIIILLTPVVLFTMIYTVYNILYSLGNPDNINISKLFQKMFTLDHLFNSIYISYPRFGEPDIKGGEIILSTIQIAIQIFFELFVLGYVLSFINSYIHKYMNL